MEKFKIQVTETLSRVLEIEAKTETDAVVLAKSLYDMSEIVLGSDDLVNCEITPAYQITEVDYEPRTLEDRAEELRAEFAVKHKDFGGVVDGGYSDCDQWGSLNGCEECPFWTRECACDAEEYLITNGKLTAKPPRNCQCCVHLIDNYCELHLCAFDNSPCGDEKRMI